MSTKQTTHRFPIGTKYKPLGKYNKSVHTVTDQMTVTNSKGEIVKTYYVSTHKFMDQTITNYEVCDTTIARGLIQNANN